MKHLIPLLGLLLILGAAGPVWGQRAAPRGRKAEPARLPPWRTARVLGVPVPLLHMPATGGFAPALLQYLKGGRRAPDPGEAGAAPEAPMPDPDPVRPFPDPGARPGAAPPPTGEPRLVLVTGPSGAGRSTAIRALEDIGFEAIDNLPLSFLPRLFSGGPVERPVVIGIDPRNREFSIAALLRALIEIEATAVA